MAVGFLFQAMEHLQNFINDCDKRTELAKRRLKETQEELSEEATQKVINGTALTTVGFINLCCLLYELGQDLVRKASLRPEKCLRLTASVKQALN